MTPIATHIHFSGAIGRTGALKQAERIQQLLEPTVESLIVVSDDWRDEQGLDSRAIRLPVRIPTRSAANLLRYALDVLKSARALLRLVRDRNASTVIANDFFYLEPAIIRLFGFRGQIVTWVRIDSRRYGLAGKLWLAATKFASDEVVAVSDFIASTLPRGMPFVRIHDSVSIPDVVAPARGQRLLFVGNYIDGKGQDEAIRAFHRIAEEFPRATLKFVGGDLGIESNRQYRRRLEQEASDGPGSGRISFHDFTEDTRAELDDCLAAINLSQSESFSLTCLEAAASGRAVIATRCGGPEEIVRHEKTGLLVEVGDIEAAAGAMRQILSDPALAERMGKEGHADARLRFGEENFVRQVKRVLRVDAAAT